MSSMGSLRKRFLLALVLLGAFGAVLAVSELSSAEDITFIPEGTKTVIESVAPLGTPLTYVSGGFGLNGFAECYPTGPGCGPLNVTVSSAFAANSIDHYWLYGQDNNPLTFTSATPLTQVFGIPGVDHGPSPQESLEWQIFGVDANGAEQGRILAVYRDGFDTANTTAGHSDDYTTLWGFSQAYTTFRVEVGDHLSPAYNSDDFELDALAAPRGTNVPEPTTVLLFGSGLVGLALWRKACAYPLLLQLVRPKFLPWTNRETRSILP